ncbi:relaxase/mobilization nuclease domain-containing protein [Mesorhizobium sp. CO1-1-8]|uniref:relaxase/mobilization nuclease domain-containing protein n=1 Tax=Mesorhizobium sp. CO1-1-8 TaxID=2876631 RepID=UPI001CD08954|nr:conjugal transfer protein TraA [Mesorhizobium sp. CO1-1-8]MBZ9772346.1 conjugal transfer protein TraA [Mesorhizobium sp. CO1-1-8]
MEFFLGAFERDWERRRAALLHELHMGEHEELDWDRLRRGGVAHLPAAGGGWSGSARRQSHAVALRGIGGGRPMRARFAALARGSQPAVVKLASYGGGIRAAAMMSYASRSAELPVENERGERIVGKSALTELRAEWQHLFDNRAASRDVGLFEVTIPVSLIASVDGRYEFAREILRAGFGERRFVHAVQEKDAGELEIRGIVVLRDPNGERLTADAKATAIVQERIDNFDFGREAEVRFRFSGYGNGVEFATARVRELVERVQQGGVRDETARIIGDFEEARDLVQKEWRRELHSRKGRDVMHLVVSARSGTDATAFQAAVRDFLGEQFGGHRYVFALHDPADDPKEIGQGGRRPHVHAHAIVTMRSETGDRVVTSPQVFRQWRALIAEKAREHGIDMEMTDRREFGNPPAYARYQVRPVSYAGRTEHKGTSRAAQVRYDGKRANRHAAPRSERSVGYALAAVQVWGEIKHADPNEAVSDFARAQIDGLQAAFRESQIDIGKFDMSLNAKNLRVNMIELEKLVGAGGPPMRAMTRTEFETYEQRVEAVLATFGAAIALVEKKDFDKIAATAREVVEIRREYLELTEREPDAGTGTRQQESAVRNDEWDRAVARHGPEIVERGNDVMLEVEIAREARDRAIADGRDPLIARGDIERELQRAARLAIAGNSWLREIAETDQDLQKAIDVLERPDTKAERDQIVASGPGVEDEWVPSTDADKPLSPGLVDGTSTAVSTESEPLRFNAPAEQMSQVDDQLEVNPDIARDARRQTRDRERTHEMPDTRRPADGRSDPPQQQVPRLRELEREVAERHDRERDEKER